MTPVIEGEIALREKARPQETLRVLGIDILRDRSFRDYPLTESPDLPSDRLLSRLLDPSSAILAEKFAAPRGLQVGSTFDAIAADRTTTLTVRGLLKDEGPARVLDGHFVLMDIAAAQFLLDRLGRIDRVEIRLEDPARIESAEQEIRARLPAGLAVQRPAQRGRQVEQMLAAFHLNLTALSYIALVVGLFLVYNTVSVAVLSRRGEIGVLRALGVTRSRVRTLFLAEAATFAVAGCSAGVVLGRFLANGAVALTATTVSTLYIRTAAAPPALDWSVIVLAFAVGVPLVPARGGRAGTGSHPRAAGCSDSRLRPGRYAHAAATPLRRRCDCLARAGRMAGDEAGTQRTSRLRLRVGVRDHFRGVVPRACGLVRASLAPWTRPSVDSFTSSTGWRSRIFPRRSCVCPSRWPRLR